MITVQDLIIELAKFDPDTGVVARGYESGYDAVTEAKEITVRYYPDMPWYEGTYQDAKDDYIPYAAKSKILTVISIT